MLDLAAGLLAAVVRAIGGSAKVERNMKSDPDRSDAAHAVPFATSGAVTQVRMMGGPRGRAASTTMAGGAVEGGRTAASAIMITGGANDARPPGSAKADGLRVVQSGQTMQSAGWCGAGGVWSEFPLTWQMVVASPNAVTDSIRGTTAP
jgi:hypothetical protein